MKRFLIVPVAVLLSACSTNSQLNVVDGLTLVAANDGVAFNPSRWFIGHPLQTTYVSLNGQLGLQIGQVCTASRYRSPFTNNCREIENTGKYYFEYFEAAQSPVPSNSQGESKVVATAKTESLQGFLDAVYKEHDAQIKYVGAVTDYYVCLAHKKSEAAKKDAETVQQGADIAKDTVVKQDDESATEQENSEKSSSCERSDLNEALKNLQIAQNEVRKQSMTPNRVVYNWAEALKFDGGVVVKEASNSISGNREKQASGYTVVNGLHIQRFQLTCNDLQELKQQYGDSNRVKIVTMTLSADELYYDAREYKAMAFNANASFSPSELKALKKIMELDDVEVEVNATLASTSDLSSKGHLMAPQVKYNKDDIKKGLTYYAVLTDLKSFQCSKNDSDAIIAMMNPADKT